MTPTKITTPHATDIVKLVMYHAHSEAPPDFAKITPKPRLTTCCSTPAKACLDASKNHTTHGRLGRSVDRLYTSVPIAETARPSCTSMANVPPSSEHRGGGAELPIADSTMSDDAAAMAADASLVPHDAGGERSARWQRVCRRHGRRGGLMVAVTASVGTQL